MSRKRREEAASGVFAGPQEKWGQPCGRPHSHRRVGPEGHLTPGVSMPPERLLRVSRKRPQCRPALAPVPVPSGAQLRSEDLCRSTRRFRDRSLDLEPRTVACFARRRCRQPRRQTEKSDLADFAPPRLQRFETESCVQSEPWGYPDLIPPPRWHRRRVETVPKSLVLSGC